MTVVRLEPDGNGATSNWTKEGAKEKWEEVAQPTMQANKKLKDGSTEEVAQAEKKPSEAEGKARGVKSITSGQVQQFGVSAKQIEEKIAAGSVIKRLVFRWFGKPATAELLDQIEIGVTEGFTEEQVLTGTAEVFHLGTLTKAHTEALTRAKLIERLRFQLTQPATGAESRVAVVYIEVEYEAGSEGVVGKAAGAMLLIGAAVATLRSVVTGTAGGALLLTGTATGTVRSVVAAKATGTLTLTGTSQATLAEVISGKATGAFLLTGTAAGTLRSNVAGKATGHMLLTGSGKAFRPAKETKRALILIFED